MGGCADQFVSPSRSLNFCELIGIKSCFEVVSKQELLNHLVRSHNNDVRWMIGDGHLDTRYKFTMPIPKANSRAHNEYIAFSVNEQYCLFCPVILILAIRFSRGRISWVPYILGSKMTAGFYGCRIQIGETAEPV